MRRSLYQAVLCLAAALALAVAAGAQEKKDGKKADTTRINGRVQMISKDVSTITVQRGNDRIGVKYDASTKFTYDNKPSTIDEVKEGRRSSA